MITYVEKKILLVTFYVARFVASLIRSVLVTAGADGLPGILGVGGVFTGMLLPSALAARLIVFFAMLFAVVEAANRLGFTQVRDIVTLFIEFGGHVLMGAVILVIGYWLADLARRVIQQAEGDHSVLFARIASSPYSVSCLRWDFARWALQMKSSSWPSASCWA